MPQLVKHDEWNYHLHATPPAAPLATRMAVEAAMAIVDVVRSDELRRLRICESTTTAATSWSICPRTGPSDSATDGCGNRAAVAAYRARKSAPATS